MNTPATFTVDDPRFTTGVVVGPSMLTLDGPEHRRHRAPFAGPFRLDAVRERFTAVVADETERLIDAFEPAGRTELRRSFAGPLAAAVVMHALGLRGTDPAVVLGWYDGIVEAVDELTKGRPLGERGQTLLRGPARRARAGARPRGGRLAGRGRGAGRGRARARGGGLQRRRPDVRRHRDDRGDDRQRGPAPAREPGRAARASRPTRAWSPRRSRSRCGSSRPRRCSIATRRATSSSAARRSAAATSSASR